MTMKALIAFPVTATALLAIPHWAQSPSPPAETALRDQGKQIFTSHCGKCHDADANKNLPDGTTLLKRLAANKDPHARLATRLKSMSEQDSRAVVLYMDDLIAQFRAGQKTAHAER